MKHLLLTTIAAVVLVGCVESEPSASDMSISEAAEFGYIEVVKQHIAAGADVNVRRGTLRFTPLHLAAGRGHKETVELLIAAVTDVNAKIDDGRTPLDLAIRYDEIDTADLLRKHGGKTGEELKAEGK